jgi:hypothetical protein
LLDAGKFETETDCEEVRAPRASAKRAGAKWFVDCAR